MSIEAIKEALEAYSNAVDAVIATQEGDDPHAAALAVQGVERAQEVWKTWTQPEYIAPLIERLEAAEKDAARYAWLRDSHPADGGVWAAMGIPNTPAGISCWRHEELDAAIDSAMAGGLAEGVSDA